MLLEHVPFFKGAGVKQQFDAFAGGEFPLAVLGVDAFLATAKVRRISFFQPVGE